MTRKKKSRKPGVGSSGIRKTDIASSSATASDKKPKKKTGKAAGSRQLEGANKRKSTTTNKVAKDPRIGSKKPIELGLNINTVATTKTDKPAVTQTSNKFGIAKVRAIATTPDIAEQLAAIENDQRLQRILAKQEQQKALSDEEVDLYNELMDEYERLSAELDEQDADNETDAQPSLDDNDLWDKLDTSDFTDYADDPDKP